MWEGSSMVLALGVYLKTNCLRPFVAALGPINNENIFAFTKNV